MPKEASGKQMQATWLVYLAKEEKNHEKDIAQAQGKVTEIQELRTRVLNTCLYCTEYIYPSYKEAEKGFNMIKHVQEAHPAEAEEAQEGKEEAIQFLT
jgi:hypothetical protein|tara:strand:- start:520 stop:813 length:294 start_codon:yes stop_codon:yes gene_type:complete